jgi:hypothetical protein
MSDSLENGAGYCSHFRDPNELHRLLQSVASPDDALVGSHHCDACQTSCPDCLRDYANLAWHCILDWRLALDLARLALDPSSPVDFTVAYWQSLLATATAAYFRSHQALGATATTFGGLPAVRSANRCEIIVHPLWSAAHPQLVQAIADAQTAGMSHIQPKTLFEVVRRPF